VYYTCITEWQNQLLQCCIAALQQLVYKISLTCKDWALFNCTARKFSVHFQQLNNLGWLSYPSSTPAPYGWSSRSVLAKFWSSPSSTGKSVQIERTISRSTSTCKSPLSECQPAHQHIQICKRMCTSLETDCTGGKKNNNNNKQESLSETYVLFKLKSSCRGCFTMVKIELNASLTRLVHSNIYFWLVKFVFIIKIIPNPLKSELLLGILLRYFFKSKWYNTIFFEKLKGG
jgi:hypothetical protein